MIHCTVCHTALSKRSDQHGPPHKPMCWDCFHIIDTLEALEALEGRMQSIALERADLSWRLDMLEETESEVECEMSDLELRLAKRQDRRACGPELSVEEAIQERSKSLGVSVDVRSFWTVTK